MVSSFGPPTHERCQLTRESPVAEMVKARVCAIAGWVERPMHVQPREKRSREKFYRNSHSLKEAIEQMELDSSQKWMMKARKATDTGCCK